MTARIPFRLFKNILWVVQPICQAVNKQKVVAKFTKHFAIFTLATPFMMRLSFFNKRTLEIEDQKKQLNTGNLIKWLESELKKTLEKADALYANGDYAALVLFLEAEESKSDELLWRLARGKYELGRIKLDKKERLKDLEEALKLLKEALYLNEKNGYAHKWYAIILEKIMSNKGIKEKITNATRIKDHLEMAIQYIPNDATTYYILGVWCYTVADLSWAERNIAAVIYAKPPSQTYQDALNYFEEAERIDPMFYNSNLLMLGKCYIQTGQTDKAKDALLKARDYPVKTDEDKEVRKEAEKLLKKFKV